MIDEYNEDGTGFARFSDDRTMRYRLARSLTSRPITTVWSEVSSLGSIVTDAFMKPIDRCVFLMVNPSTADAFKPDPTITECCKRSIALGAEVLEVVNLFAWVSPFPRDLKKRSCGYRGDDTLNNQEIIRACTNARWVVAAWGNDGALDNRDNLVRNMLRIAGVRLHHLGTTMSGHPKHPLARGHHRIPEGQELVEFT